MFIDQAKIHVKGGKGGKGCVSFRREKFVPQGGPDGGDGGNGGNVYLQADSNLATLMDLLGHHHWKGGKGTPGKGKDMSGKRGKHTIVRVPPGTLIYDDDADIIIKDLVEPGRQVCVAEGGKGGRGNKAFTTSTNQSPRQAEPGQEGRERNLRLELKLIADLGLIGMPNAGKSTLLSRVSSARPKIASYPFTTKHPILGIADLTKHRRLVIADIPGLIEGAHEGAGMGDEFLRHIERTIMLVHVIDIEPMEGDPYRHYLAIREELEKYSLQLAQKPEIIAVNKMDLTDSGQYLQQFREKVNAEHIFPISAVTGSGVTQLLEYAYEQVSQQRPDQNW